MKYIEMLLSISRSNLLRFTEEMQMPDMKLMSRRQIAGEIDKRMRNGKIDDMIYSFSKDELILFRKAIKASYCYKAQNDEEKRILDYYCRYMLVYYDMQKKGYIVPEEVGSKILSLSGHNTFSSVQNKRQWIMECIIACVRIYHIFSLNVLLPVCNKNLIPPLNEKELLSEIGHIPSFKLHAAYRQYMFIDNTLEQKDLSALSKAVSSRLGYSYPSVQEIHDIFAYGYPVSQQYVQDFTLLVKRKSGLNNVESIVRECWKAGNLNNEGKVIKTLSDACSDSSEVIQGLKEFLQSVPKAHLKGGCGAVKVKPVFYEGSIMIHNEDNNQMVLMERNAFMQKLMSY